MSNPYVGEIRIFAASFAPCGWAFCDGTPMPISENEVLFQLIGTTYGGDGQETFNLPDLRGRLPMHAGTGPGGSSNTLGEQGGVEQVTLTINQIPAHNHALLGTANFGGQTSPGNNIPARSTSTFPYTNDLSQGNVNMAAQSISPVGGSQPHDNLQPYLCVNFIIALFGIFP